MTTRVYLCLYCETAYSLMRLKPTKLMACQRCVKSRGGIANILAHGMQLHEAQKDFVARRAKEGPVRV